MLYLGAKLALKRPGVRRIPRVRKRNIFLRNYGSGKRTEPSTRTVGEILSCRFMMCVGRAWRPGILKTVDVRVGTGEDDSGPATNKFTQQERKTQDENDIGVCKKVSNTWRVKLEKSPSAHNFQLNRA